MVYLFLGQDSLSKDAQIKKIKQEFLPKSLEDFNYDLLYAKELDLKTLQEKFLALPVKSPKRIIVIKDAQDLKEECRDFILKFVHKAHKETVLILDIGERARHSEFIRRLTGYAKTYRFREVLPLDTFSLSRQINLRQPVYALRTLNQLLKEGERPERILGGLRYAWEREGGSLQQMRKRLKLLLNCDINIKTGRMRPEFALEKLVLELMRP